MLVVFIRSLSFPWLCECPIRSKHLPSSRRVSLRAAVLGGVCAEGIDTEHIFAFMIGADVGTFGEREFQSQTTGRFGRNGGTYRSLGQELELELVPFRNFRVEVGAISPRMISAACRALRIGGN